jgi:hypothetical protein
MAAVLSSDVLEDDLAVSLARVIASANRRAIDLGIDLGKSVITISQVVVESSSSWRVNYGPQDYISRRGGDLIIDVAPEDGAIRQVLRGQ